MITLTESAAKKVKELVEAEGNNELALRVAVRPGGCSGFSYEMFFDTDVTDDDNVTSFGDVRVVVDASSAAAPVVPKTTAPNAKAANLDIRIAVLFLRAAKTRS